MAAKQGGGSTSARKRAHDQEMARRLKQDGVERSVFRCPICNAVVSVQSAYNHVAFHPC